MSKAYSKVTLIGTLTCILAAIIVGSALAKPGPLNLSTTTAQKPLAAPGYSDFPEVVRTMNEWNASKALTASVVAKGDSGFKWGDAGVGAGTILALTGILALVTVGIKRRSGTSAHA
jgi:hypothetical protein